jgi:hypothetical protein
VTTRTESTCPHCGAAVDPLRAGAVSIVGGRIIHFCSPSCRSLHLKRTDASEPRIVPPTAPAAGRAPLDSGAAPAPVQMSEEDVDATAESSPAPTRAVRTALPLLAPLAIEAGLLLLSAAAVALLPHGALGDLFPLGLTALAIVADLVHAALKEQRQGISRVAEVVAPHVAAALLVASSFFRGGARYPLVCAAIALAVEPLSRAVEILGRKRSGVLDVITGVGASAVANEWRDNSSTAARVRRFALALGWARYLFAAAVGGLLFAAHALPAPDALVSAAVALLALNTRALRLATGDAHLATALMASRRGIAIRDAHAVERLGLSRIAVFSAQRTLLEPSPKIVDWQVQPGFEPSAVATLLAALESKPEGRFAAAISAFAMSRAAQPFPRVESWDAVPGVGVHGRVDGVPVSCGTRLLFLERGISNAELEPWASEVETTGRRAFFVGVGDRIAATFAVEENPSPAAADAVRRLSLLGLEPAMITSAEVEPARALGARLGIERVHFGIREAQMSSVLEEITAAGDTAVLFGSGPRFEEAARSATAAVALGTGGPTLADVDMKEHGLDAAISVIAAARSARASVRGNIAGLVIAVGVGAGLSGAWPTPGAAVATCIFGAAAGAACTINRPFPWAAALASKVSKRASRVTKWIRARLGPAGSREEKRQF